MATRKTTPRGPKRAAAAKPEVAGFWDTNLRPFLDRHGLVFVLLFAAIASARIISTYTELSLTYDEPGHFACGLEYVSKHVYRYEAQHPPLSRAMMAILPYLDGARLLGNPGPDTEGPSVIEHSGHPERMIFLMRLGILAFFWMACSVVYLWTRRFWSKATAVLAVLLFTLSPTVLAHAGLATTDMALTATLPTAFFALLLWAEEPTWMHSVLLGAMAALAALSKFTSLGYLPAAALLAFAMWYLRRRPSWSKLAALARLRIAPFGAAVLTGAFVVWAAYWFSFGEAPGWHVKVPAWEFVQGVTDAMHRNTGGHGSPGYLFGETSYKGWWYFFPVALAVKTPLAMLLLMALGILICCRRLASTGEMGLLAFLLGVMLPAMSSPVNIGVRHVLPVYVSLSIIAALGLAAVVRWANTRTVAILAGGTLIVWAAISGAAKHPDYISYFNEFASGHPENVLVDSDLDWGQGYKLVARWLSAHGVMRIAVKLNGGRYHPKLDPLPPMTDVDDYHPAEGWSVIGATDMKHVSHHQSMTETDLESIKRAMQPKPAWFDLVEPVDRVGGLMVFYVPPGTADAFQLGR